MRSRARTTGVVDDGLERIDFLDGHGHLSLTWDPSIPESVERARKDFADLLAQGYEFFRVISREPSPGFDPAAGALEVVRISASDVEPRIEPVEPIVRAASTAEGPTQSRRGRARKERVVAARPMAGG